MSTAEIVSNVVALLALLVSIVAVVRSSKENTTANDLRKEHLALRHGQVEIELRSQIIESRRSVAELFNEHADFLARDQASLDDGEKRRRDRLKISANESIEGYLSALDAACQAYLDKKIDTVRFKKSYQREIRQAVQHDAHAEFLKAGHALHALMKVYDEWENPERG